MKRFSSFGFLPSSQAEEAESQDRGKRAKHANSTLDKEGPLMYASPVRVYYIKGLYRRLRMRDRSRGRG